MRRKFLLFSLFFAFFSNNLCQSQPKTEDSSLKIIKFYTRIGVTRKDSVWNINSKIRLYSQPTFISITVRDSDTNPNYTCFVNEPIKINETVKMGSNNTINFFNLSGGDYELTFINQNNNHQAKINFSIEPVFWEQWWFSPFLFIVISTILGLIFYFFYLIRLRQQLHLQSVRHELEIKALRAQMNPHFIFNSMNTIDAYILRKRFVEASDCLQKFSKLIRKILENSESQTISIDQELETLRLYIELEQERFSHSFDYHFDIEPMLLEDDYQIPPLLIQPFVENAILHGIRNLTDRKGEIIVKLNIVSGTDKNISKILLCQIHDNGIGRKASTELNAVNNRKHRSMGVDITLERISTYQAIFGDKMQTQITDLEMGTKVEIRLPLILNSAEQQKS